MEFNNNYLIDVTSQPLATAYLQMREPKKPLPPQTMSFLAAADMTGDSGAIQWGRRFVAGDGDDTNGLLTGVIVFFLQW
jgi:hypothetical protein